MSVSTGVGAAVTAAENSDVLPAGSVAVAVTTDSPIGSAGNVVMLKPASPAESVVREIEPKRVLPSPNPDAFTSEFEKNCNVKVVFGVLFKDPSMVVFVGPATADNNTGKFCK